jgi:hypothetical protein
MFLDSKLLNLRSYFQSHFCTHCPPSIFARTRKADFISSPYSAPSARPHFSLTPEQVSDCEVILTFARNYFEEKSS